MLDDDDDDNDNEIFEDYFLSTDESNVYGKSPDLVCYLDNMITGTKLVQWLPLDAIHCNKNPKKVQKI